MKAKISRHALDNVVQKEKLALKKLYYNDTFLFKGFSKDRLVKKVKEEKLPYVVRDVKQTIIISPIDGTTNYCATAKLVIAQYLAYKIEFNLEQNIKLEELLRVEDELVIYDDCLYTNNIILTKNIELIVRSNIKLPEEFTYVDLLSLATDKLVDFNKYSLSELMRNKEAL